MSASIYYRPIAGDRHIDVAAPSIFVSAMVKAFGSYPWSLGATSVPTLQGMAALCCDGAQKNPYETIIEVIERDGTLEVWPVY